MNIFQQVEICLCSIKSGLLDALTRETETSVRNSAAQVVGSIAKHELGDKKWPELLEFIQRVCCQGKANERELGLYILSVVADLAGEELKMYLKAFISIIHSALQDTNTNSAYYAGLMLKNMIPYIGTEEAVRYPYSVFPDNNITILFDHLDNGSAARPQSFGCRQNFGGHRWNESRQSYGDLGRVVGNRSFTSSTPLESCCRTLSSDSVQQRS